MAYMQSRPIAGRHFLMLPGPTNTPDRILRAMDNAVLDHRGPDFAALTKHILPRLGPVFGTAQPVIVFPASGTGAWEAAMVNTLSPNDAVLMVRTGQFATLWEDMARRLGLETVMLETDWRRGADPEAIGRALREDRAHRIRAVCVVHNETSTGCVTDVAAVRAAIDAAGHPALLLVDTVSGLGAMAYEHDAWGVDVTVSGSQKGLMMPPGLAFNAVSERALAAGQSAQLPRSYWDWASMLASNATGQMPYTPATNLLYGLDTALAMIEEQTLAGVIARHARLAAATRAAVAAWGLETQCADERAHSNAVTAVRMPDGRGADALRALILERFDMSLGAGLGQVKDALFRIGHLGDLNDLTLLGALSGIEMGLRLAGVTHRAGGVQAAIDHLSKGASA